MRSMRLRCVRSSTSRSASCSRASSTTSSMPRSASPTSLSICCARILAAALGVAHGRVRLALELAHLVARAAGASRAPPAPRARTDPGAGTTTPRSRRRAPPPRRPRAGTIRSYDPVRTASRGGNDTRLPRQSIDIASDAGRRAVWRRATGRPAPATRSAPGNGQGCRLPSDRCLRTPRRLASVGACCT